MPDSENKDKTYWKKTIMAINDRKLLDYIREMINIRLDLDRADENLEKADKEKPDNVSSTPIEYKPPRNKLKPLKMLPIKLEEAGTDKEEQLY